MRRLLALLLTLLASSSYATQEVGPAGSGGGGGSSLPDPVTVAHGGTGATTTSAARSALGAAAKGANADITSLTGLSTALPITEGGTGAITAGAALTGLGAAPATRTVSTTAPLTGGGDLSADRAIAIPAATSLADGYLAHTDWVTFNSKAASGANADITSLSKIGTSGIVFDDGEVTPKTVTVGSPATLNASYSLTWPADAPTTVEQPLCFGGSTTLAWCSPLTGFISGATFNTKTQALAGTHPMVAAFCTAADGNQDVVAGGNAVCDGVDNSGGFGLSGGAVILTAQTDPTQNGLWDVNGFGAWSYDPSWGDPSGGCNVSNGYILSVKPGGTTYGDTVWQVKCDSGTGNATFMQIGPVTTRAGSCTIASNILSTTATNLTCTGVPASTHVAVRCSGQAAFSTATANGLYCRATGTINQIACNTIAANTTAMAYSCEWTQP